MDDRKTPQSGNQRTITYRVGWRSGTIRIQDGAAGPAPRVNPPKPEGRPSMADLAAGWMLREAPLPPARMWPYLLAGVPAVTFLAAVALILLLYQTAHGGI